MVKMTLKFSMIFLLACSIGQVGAGTGNVSASENVTFINELKEGLQEPIDTAISHDGRVYVLDKHLAKVFVYSNKGLLEFTIGKQGFAPGEFYQPHAISISRNGHVIVADTGNSRLQLFSSQGEFIGQIGQEGSLAGEFKSPDSLAVDRQGNIYVGDSKSKRITKFSPYGIYLEHRKLTFTPTDLVFDLDENLYVLLPSIGRIIKYDLETKGYDQITYQEKGKSLISETADISVDINGHIYLVETASHSIKKIDQNKTLLFSYGSKGDGEGQFNWPAGVTSDRTGRIYVADARNKRVQVFENSESAGIDQRPETPRPALHDIHENDTKERIFLTKISQPLELINTPDRITYAISKNMILDEIKTELAFKLGLEKETLSEFIQVEAEERLSKGQIKLTVSIPKEIPLESSVILSRM